MTGATIGLKLYATGRPGAVRVLLPTAGYDSDLYLLLSDHTAIRLANNHADVGRTYKLPVFTAGSELIFYIHVTPTNQTFQSGPGSRNQDGIAHAAVLNLGGGTSRVGFEDAYGGGDLDYDDSVFEFTGVTPDQPPVADAGDDQTVECAGSATPVTLDGTGSSDPENQPLTYTWSENGHDIATGAQPAINLSDGLHTITLTVSDGNSSTTDTVQINIVDTTAPIISNASVSQASLWPPNHKMVDITVGYSVRDNCDSAAELACSLKVTSNEPVNGLGDGDTAPDWEVVDAHHVRLRAERAGGGNGRVYTITITCADSSGNSASKTVTVTVPHNK